MKKRYLIPLLATAFFASCTLEDGKCPQAVEVPFVNVTIPDSVAARKNFTIDARLHDLGCYQSAALYYGIVGDTVYLTAIAEYDECSCPEPSNDLTVSCPISLDTVSGSKLKYFEYWQINNTKDSIRFRRDTIVIY